MTQHDPTLEAESVLALSGDDLRPGSLQLILFDQLIYHSYHGCLLVANHKIDEPTTHRDEDKK